MLFSFIVGHHVLAATGRRGGGGGNRRAVQLYFSEFV